MITRNKTGPYASFTRLSSYRQKHFVESALKVFAENGYHNASIQDIAKATELSVGTVYQYFPSKEALFMYVVHQGFGIIKEVVNQMESATGTFEERIYEAFHLSITKAKENADYLRIYLDLTQHPQEGQIAEELYAYEDVCIKYYTSMLSEAKEKGLVRQDLDIPMAAFTIDNLLLMTMQSLASPMYGERMVAYLGKDSLDTEVLCRRMTNAVIASLGVRDNA